MEYDDIIQDFEMESIGQNSIAEESIFEDVPSLGETENESVLGNFSQISFGGHIDDLYDPSIKSAQDSLIHHLHEATEARTADDLKFHLEQAESARKSENFWQDAKHDAEIESEKNKIFIDGINKQWEIMDRYQKEIEDIYRSH